MSQRWQTLQLQTYHQELVIPSQVHAKSLASSPNIRTDCFHFLEPTATAVPVTIIM